MSGKYPITETPISTDPAKSSCDVAYNRLADLARNVSVGMSSETASVNKTGFRMMALNIFSLMPHLDELRIFVSEKKPHTIGITETKIDSSIDDSDIEIDDYVVVRNDRDKYGGRVAMYIHKSVNYQLREDLFRINIESISVQVKIGNYKPFIVTTLYRPPGKPVTYFNDIDTLFGTIDSEDKETIYLGDTNCDMLDFANNDTKHLINILTKYNLIQLIKSPTRTTATTKTIIDHIITNRPESVSENGVLASGISDHDVVFLTKHMRLPKLKVPPKQLQVRNYKRFNLHAFRQDMNKIPFEEIRNVARDANEMWILWKAFFLDILNKHAPITNIQIKGNKIPYVTSELKSMIRQRDYLRAKANKTGSCILRQAYNQIRAKVNQKLYLLRKNYYNNKIEQHKGDLKTT